MRVREREGREGRERERVREMEGWREGGREGWEVNGCGWLSIKSVHQECINQERLQLKDHRE